MQALEFYKTVTMDRANLLERLTGLFAEHDVPYCIIGGQAVNAYVEPLVSLDLDIVVAVERFQETRALLERAFKVAEFPHSLHISLAGSDLRVQIQTDPRYGEFVKRAERREVLGVEMPVACVQDVLQGKAWAAQDSTRRASKRRKDLLDIERLLEAYPDLRERVPEEVLKRLL